MNVANAPVQLSAFLSDCASIIQQKHPRLSATQIAVRLGIAKSTYDRISKAEVEKTSFKNAIEIFRMAHGEHGIKEFIQEHYPKMYKQFSKTYVGNENADFISKEAESFLQDPTTYELVMLATSKAGLRKETIVQEYGNKGLRILNCLLKSDAITERDNLFFLTKSVNASQETVQKLLVNLISHSYDQKAFGDKDNWLTVQYESLNKEIVLPIIRNILIRANNEIRDTIHNPENAGNDLVWIGLASDSFTNENNVQGLQ